MLRVLSLDTLFLIPRHLLAFAETSSGIPSV